mmetsp:Transcript_29843/g.96294  ORF Transcript_29843/g.96294 Transcript_29843/m.96294 type:complete len:118 (-) Transcript_29843:1023-1376(-)
MVLRCLVVLASLASAFYAPPQRAAVRLLAAKTEVPDYGSMTLEVIQAELEKTKKEMFGMNVEKWQAKKKSFDSAEYRELKKKVARMMPFYELKRDEKEAADAETSPEEEEAAPAPAT